MLEELFSIDRGTLVKGAALSCFLLALWGEIVKGRLVSAGIDRASRAWGIPAVVYLHLLYTQRSRVRFAMPLFVVGCFIWVSFTLSALIIVLRMALARLSA